MHGNKALTPANWDPKLAQSKHRKLYVYIYIYISLSLSLSLPLLEPLEPFIGAIWSLTVGTT